MNDLPIWITVALLAGYIGFEISEYVLERPSRYECVLANHEFAMGRADKRPEC